MSVLIKGMKKPEHCGYCRFRYDGICHALQKTQYAVKDCPLIELPDHGDLMDKDKFYIDLMDRGVDHVQTDDYTEICQAVCNAPVVIPAERSENEQSNRTYD